MRAYIITTGIVFALLAASHVLRVAVEGAQVLSEPIFVFTTIASVALALWALYLIVRSSKS